LINTGLEEYLESGHGYRRLRIRIYDAITIGSSCVWVVSSSLSRHLWYMRCMITTRMWYLQGVYRGGLGIIGFWCRDLRRHSVLSVASLQMNVLHSHVEILVRRISLWWRIWCIWRGIIWAPLHSSHHIFIWKRVLQYCQLSGIGNCCWGG